MTNPPLNCWKCSAAVSPPLPMGRREACPRCGADLHVCRMCGFWDPAANNQCRESQADRVVEKEAANFCDWFRPTQRQGGGETDEAQAARKKLEAVFGQSEGLKGGTSEAEAARKKLEDLFKPKKQTGLKSQD